MQHKYDPKQVERDTRKNRILSNAGLALLRIGTRDFDVKEKVTNAIRSARSAS